MIASTLGGCDSESNAAIEALVRSAPGSCFMFADQWRAVVSGRKAPVLRGQCPVTDSVRDQFLGRTPQTELSGLPSDPLRS